MMHQFATVQSAMASHGERKSLLTAVALLKRWIITLEAATATIDAKEAGVRNVFSLSERKVRKKAPWLEFPSIKGEIYVDSMFSTLQGIRGLKGGSVYTNGLGYDRFYPWKSKGD
jgi:hypothetical protein